MNWLQALDTIESVDNLKIVFNAMDKVIVNGKATTYYNISEATEPHLTEAQIEGILRRFRAKYQKDSSFVVRAKLIANHFGINGSRKILG